MAKQTFTTGQVLTAAQMTSLQQTAMLGGAASAKVASYTLVAADAGTAITMSNASATTITVNTALFAAGDTVYITNVGAGVCTITAGTATVNTSSSLALAQYEGGTLNFTSTSAAIFIKGDGASATSGGMTLLATTTLSGTSTVVTSINQTYNSLVMVGSSITFSANAAFRVNPNSVIDSLYVTGVFSGTNSSPTNIQPYSSPAIASSSSNAFFVKIDNYTSTGYKPIQFSGAHLTTPSTSNMAGAAAHTAAITSLQYTTTAGTATLGGTVLLYGVK